MIQRRDVVSYEIAAIDPGLGLEPFGGERARLEPGEILARHAFSAAAHALGLACRRDVGEGARLSFLLPASLAHAVIGLAGFEISSEWGEPDARMVMIQYWEENPTQASVLSAIGRLGRCLGEAGWYGDTATALDLVAATYRND